MAKKNKGYFKYFRVYIVRILFAFFLSSIATGTTFVSTRLLSKFVDLLSEAKTLKSLQSLIVFWLCTELTGIITRFTSSASTSRTTSKIQADIQLDLARKIANSTPASVSKNSPNALVERIRDDANTFVEAIGGIYGEFFSVILGIAALCFVYACSVEIFLIFTTSLVIILVIQVLMTKRMVSAMSSARRATIDVKSLWLQIFEAFPDIKIQSLEEGIKRHISAAMKQDVSQNLASQQERNLNSLVANLMSLISQIVFLICATLMVLDSSLDFSNFVAIYMYKGYIYNLVGSTLKMARNYAQLQSSQRRIDEIFDYDGLVEDEIWGHCSLYNPTGKISIRNLFVHFGNFLAIDDLSVEIEAGQFVAIVGTSGSGKSTILNVLSRITHEFEGSVLLDGIELRDLTRTSLRKAITMAPQFPMLFGLTIRTNLTLHNPEVSDNEIWRALNLAAADQFVSEKGGLDILLSPNELSGGQIQRLALARMILCGSKIILMDESTSALDGESQAHIIQGIKNATSSGDHTVLFVAHRVTPLRDADKILVMDDGKLIDQGTYDELIERCQKFQRLATMG